MADFTNFIFIWNDWIVLPAFTLVALMLHIRRRKFSTLLLFVGLVAYISGNALRAIFHQTLLHPGYVAGLVITLIGLVAWVVGAVWFLRKD